MNILFHKISTLPNETEETLSGIREILNEELSRLMRVRDFISLLMTYPMKKEEEGILKSWICAFPQWKAQLLSTDYHTFMHKPWLELTGKAFRRMEEFVPEEIMRKIKRGDRSIFNHNDAIPEAILHLTVDLAVNQLIQTIFSRDYSAACYIRLSTRNLIEKRAVMNKIVSALEEKHNMFGIDKHFLRSLWISASEYESNADIRVQEEINTMMASSSVTQDRDIEEKMGSNRHLVIVVDADSNKKLDLQKVRFPNGIVVLIATEPSTQAEKDDEFRITCTMDLIITTQDHLLPWEVFCSYVGRRTIHSSMAIQRFAEQIVKECHGHLFATFLVAKYLKNAEDVKQWELALDKLSSLNPSYDYQHSDRIGISRVMVNAFVNIMWEDIDDTQKICLELSLFVHNIKIGVQEAILVSDWASTLFGYTPEMTLNLDEFDEYRRQAQYCIRELLERFVLFNRGRDLYLPIETYDIIKSLHTLNPSIIRHGALGLTEGPCIERWHDLVRIELMDNKIYELPESPDCPKLKVLLLQGNVDLMDIPDSFFNHMPLLQHLDLSSTSIRDLPSSLFKLIQLEKFNLRGCDLFMELPPQIGQLRNLEELDLGGTLITHMPKEIGELINLKSLRLCFDGYHHELGHDKKGRQISNSTIIPQGVISNLTQLKYLNINVDPEDERWNENVNGVFKEILGLKRLETVSIFVPKANLLKLMPAHKSLKFRLVVGHHMRRFISRVTPEVEQTFKRCDYSIKFVNGENVPEVLKMNLGNFKALYLDRHMTIKSLSDFDLRNLSGLQVCILSECNEMESVVNRGFVDGHALPNLEFLSVFYMKNLRSICERPKPSFLHLKSIALHTCPMLTTVFNLDSLNNLSFLEEIIIEDCPKVTTLVSLDSPQQPTQFSVPRLRRILLLYLPELVNIFNGLHVEQGLEQMVFYYCPKLQSLSKSELSSKSLKIIKGESMWWKALKWNVADWGNYGRPNFLELIFSPINEEADMINQLAAHQEIQLNTHHNEYPEISSSTQLLAKSSLETPVFSPLAPVSDSPNRDPKVLSIECLKGTSKADDWTNDMLQTGDIVQELRIGSSPNVLKRFKSPFKNGITGVNEILRHAYKMRETSILVCVRRGPDEFAELQACIVPNDSLGKKNYVLRSITDPNYVVGFLDRTETECFQLQASRTATKINALNRTRLRDGYVSYPWERRMQEQLSVPNSSNFLSILLLPKVSDRIAAGFNDVEDTLAKANTWLNAAQASGVPIVFMNVQTESLLTKISGETASSTVNAGSLSDLSNLKNASLYGFEDYHEIYIGVVRAIRLWYAPIGGEFSIEIKLKVDDTKLGFAISRTEEGFIFISSVIDDGQENVPATRSGLGNLYKAATDTSRLLVVSRLSNQSVLPWMVSSTGAIKCYDTVSLSKKLILHRHTKVPILLHVFLWDRTLASSSAENITRSSTLSSSMLPLPYQNVNQIKTLPHQGSDGGIDVSSGGSQPKQLERDTAGDLSFRFHNVSLSGNWV